MFRLWERTASLPEGSHLTWSELEKPTPSSAVSNNCDLDDKQTGKTSGSAGSPGWDKWETTQQFNRKIWNRRQSKGLDKFPHVCTGQTREDPTCYLHQHHGWWKKNLISWTASKFKISKETLIKWQVKPQTRRNYFQVIDLIKVLWLELQWSIITQLIRGLIKNGQTIWIDTSLKNHMNI